MSNYGWTNSDGEPMMDGAAYRFEQALDADYQPDPDDYMGYNDEPDECEDDHECVDCDGPKGVWYAGEFVPGPGATWTCSYCERKCPEGAH